METIVEPENVTLEEVLRDGQGICSGYVPNTEPGDYMELYRYKGYIYAVVCKTYAEHATVHKLGIEWT